MDTQISENEKVISWDQLNRRGFDEEIVMTIVPICIEDNKERLPQLLQAIESGDAKQVMLCAHSIKGSAANVGALNLSAVAEELENAAENCDLSNARQLYDRIETEFAKLEKFAAEPDWIEKLKAG